MERFVGRSLRFRRALSKHKALAEPRKSEEKGDRFEAVSDHVKTPRKFGVSLAQDSHALTTSRFGSRSDARTDRSPEWTGRDQRLGPRSRVTRNPDSGTMTPSQSLNPPLLIRTFTSLPAGKRRFRGDPPTYLPSISMSQFSGFGENSTSTNPSAEFAAFAPGFPPRRAVRNSLSLLSCYSVASSAAKFRSLLDVPP